MRDIGAIVWVLLVVIGVVSSIVSNVRKQTAASAGARRPPVPRPPGQLPARPAPPGRVPGAATPAPAVAAQSGPTRVQPRPAAPRPVPPADFGVLPAHERPEPRPHRLATLFGDRRALVRVVIGAEVLGKPLALRDEIARR